MPVVLDRLHAERDRLLDLVDTMVNAAEDADRSLTESELQLIARHRQQIESDIDPQIERLTELEDTRAKHVRRSADLVPAPRTSPTAPGPGPVDQVVYRTFGEYARDQLITRFDQIAQRAGTGARELAAERLQRAVANTISSDVPGLLPPTYLTQIAQVISTSRPIVESSRRVNLTSGQLIYPSITQRPIVGKQTAEKTEAPSQKMTVAFVTVTADTYVGAGDISWQVITWSQPDALALWFDLAAEQYALQTEAAAGTVLAAATAQATPAVPATPTLADWNAAIVAAAATVYNTSNRPADTIYADVSSAASITALVANVAPVFYNAGSVSPSTFSGNVAGFRLVASRGLPAKTVIVGASSALMTAENSGAPVELRAIEPALGGMEVGVIGAFAAKITDAGGFRKLTIT